MTTSDAKTPRFKPRFSADSVLIGLRSGNGVRGDGIVLGRIAHEMMFYTHTGSIDYSQPRLSNVA